MRACSGSRNQGSPKSVRPVSWHASSIMEAALSWRPGAAMVGSVDLITAWDPWLGRTGPARIESSEQADGLFDALAMGAFFLAVASELTSCFLVFHGVRPAFIEIAAGDFALDDA